MANNIKNSRSADRSQIFHYIFSNEESRLGRTDYWNFIFLPGKPLLSRVCFEQLKIWSCLVMAIAAGIALSQL